MSEPMDLTGQRFGMLVVLGVSKDVYIDPKRGKKYKKWDCQCDCGKIVSRTTYSLTNKKLRNPSCGCNRIKCAKENFTKHGGRKDRLYHIWASIKDRCTRESNKYYYIYGARGISVCDEWLNDYSAFKEWAYANGYNENAGYMQCTIDRIDTNGNYCPENCRWVGLDVQSNNKSNNITIEYNGETHTLIEWSRILGIKWGTLRKRLLDLNWSVKEAFTIPVSKKKIRYNKHKEIDKHGASA